MGKSLHYPTSANSPMNLSDVTPWPPVNALSWLCPQATPPPPGEENHLQGYYCLLDLCLKTKPRSESQFLKRDILFGESLFWLNFNSSGQLLQGCITGIVFLNLQKIINQLACLMSGAIFMQNI